MNYTKASEAPKGSDNPLVEKLPVAIAVAARAKIAANDLTAAKVLSNLDAVTAAVRYPLLVDLTAAASDAQIDAAVVAMWPTIQAVANDVAV